MEVVFLQELRSTKLENVLMHVSLHQCSVKTASARERLIEILRMSVPTSLPILTHRHTAKGEHDIQLVASPSKECGIPGVLNGIHGSIDKHQDVVPNLLRVLDTYKGVE